MNDGFSKHTEEVKEENVSLVLTSIILERTNREFYFTFAAE